jgi:hypothetical protein
MRNVLIACVVVAVVLAVSFIPMVPVQETYTDTEPYQHVITEVESYEREAQYQVVSATLTQHWEPLGREIYHASEVTVKNIDSEGGTFTVTHSLYAVDGLYGRKTASDYIAPGNTKVLRAEFDTEAFQDVRAEYSVSAPTIIDERLVERTVTDERLVTKERTVHKSIFELLVQ